MNLQCHEDRIVFVTVAIECANTRDAQSVHRALLDFVLLTEEVGGVLSLDVTREQEINSFAQRK